MTSVYSSYKKGGDLTMGSKKNNGKSRIKTVTTNDKIQPGGNTADKIGKSNKSVTNELMTLWCK
jgi:hypothetical protein